MDRPFPIQCDDLTFAQSAPESEADRAALAEHLAACPHCASQVERDAALTRLWRATRPAEPDEAAWETVWARVSERLGDAERPAIKPETLPLTSVSPAHRWRRHAVAAFVAAQAAAILAAFVFLSEHRRATETPTMATSTSPSTPVASARPSRVNVDVEIESGEVVMIHLEGNTFRAVAIARDEQRPDTLDENLVLFNDAEAMAGMKDTIAGMNHDAHAAPPPG